MGAALKQAQLILQLMQGKVSQTMVAELFKDLSQKPQQQAHEKKKVVNSKVKDVVLFFSSEDANRRRLTRLPT